MSSLHSGLKLIHRMRTPRINLDLCTSLGTKVTSIFSTAKTWPVPSANPQHVRAQLVVGTRILILVLIVLVVGLDIEIMVT